MEKTIKFIFDNVQEVLMKERDLQIKTENMSRLDALKRKTFIRFRPINRHNNHMTIFVKDNKGIEPLPKDKGKAIFYYKKGLSQSVNPIEISVPENVRYLLEKFDYYSKRALKEFPFEDPKIDQKYWFKVNQPEKKKNNEVQTN